MNFFEHQESAQKKTGFLLFLFTVAVILIVLAIYAAAVGIFAGMTAKNDPYTPVTYWYPEIFLASTILTLAMIGCGSWYKTWSLSSGGSAVAESLGGRLVNRSSRDIDHRVLINVVDEMAIASGIPSPPVYVLEGESGINAFAAGYSPDDAVVAVSEGALKYLSRDELQGVVAHEFSHILNGDMRINIRLMGLLYGILLLGITGYWILLSTRGRGRSRGKEGAGFLVIGLALLIIGYTGVFFAKLIKAAVSRQREFLADASAVQFTRNPEGIGGALKKIGGYSKGSRIENPQAEDVSHLFFGNGLKSSFIGLLSTHPPLEERIRRIDPSFTGSFPIAAKAKHTADDIKPLSQFRAAGTESVSQLAGRETAGGQVAFRVEDSINRIGTLATAVIEETAGEQDPLPLELVALTEDPFGAQTVIFGLLLDRDKNIRTKQLHHLEKTADSSVLAELNRHLPSFSSIDLEMRLPLVELAVPELKQMSVEQFEVFCRNLNALVTADNELDLFEFLVSRMLLINLRPQFYGKRKRSVKYRSLKPVIKECRDLLISLADVGHESRSEIHRAFVNSLRVLGVNNASQITEQQIPQTDFQAVDRALTKLSESSMSVKQRVLQSCASCIEADGKTTVQEAEMLRVIAGSLNCPMPPLGQ